MTRRGRFWRTDKDGFLLNDADRTQIDGEYKPLIEAIAARITQHIGADVHSIYVTASLARGLAQKGVSDADIVVLLERRIDPELVMQSWRKPAEDALQKQFAHLVSAVDIDIMPDGYVFRDPDEFSSGAFYLASQSVCVWGSDIVPELPRYNMRDEKTRIAIANDDIMFFLDAMDEIKDAIHDDESDTNVAKQCKRISKKMLRGGFALTIVQSGLYTRDVDLCYEQFAQFYPEQAEAQKRALDSVHQPSCSAHDVLDYIKTHGAWLIEQCEAWLDKYNPDGDYHYVFGDDPDFEPLDE
jgi:hypothetical protein